MILCYSGVKGCMNIPMATDEELLGSCQLSDGDSFEILYHRYASELYHYTHSRINNREDSEEIIQELFIWLWSKRESLGNVTSVKSYLYSACKHAIFNYFRSHKVRRQYAEHFTLFQASYDNSTEENMDLTDLKEVLESKMKELPERCQVAFRLSRLEHLPIQTIAEQMNISTGTVENYITTALKHLRVGLGK